MMMDLFSSPGGPDDVPTTDDYVKIMSVSKQKRTLSQKAKSKGSGKKIQRNTVLLPYEFGWPVYDDADIKKELLDLLKSLIVSLRLPSRKVPLNEIRKVDKNNRPKFRREWTLAESTKVGFDVTNYFRIRKSVVMGVNSVSKNLERSNLSGVLIDKNVDPPIITQMLIPIASSKQVPLIALHGLNDLFKSTTGMRCIAFGLKKECGEVGNHFNPLLELIISQISTISQRTQLEEDTEVVTETLLKTTPISTTPHSSSKNQRKKRKNKSNNFETPKIRKVIF